MLEPQSRSIAANLDMQLRGYSVDTGAIRARSIIDKLAAAECAVG
ncbi:MULTISPECIES: hypothetical protein [unclassified Sphingomonas]|nr:MULTISPECIES: hypothetical protein [unclassified Sphingomonas]